MQRKVNSSAEYLATVPTEQLPLINHIRHLIQKNVPGLHESIRYGMLAYNDRGGLLALAAQKHYVSLYVFATQALRDMASELQDIDHGKGCLRFKHLNDFPTDTIAKLLRHAVTLSQRDCAKTI